jgi:hypothetical protein
LGLQDALIEIGARRSKERDHEEPSEFHIGLIGNLCLDLNAFADEYENASDNLLGIDYTHVLTWVVTDAATGKSTTAKQSSYVEPLQAAFASNNKGRFIRLSRLWHTAQPNPNLKEAQFRQLIDPVLKAYEVDWVLKERLLSPLGELLATFRDLRNSFVHFLELQPFNETITNRDDYNESIVNIFTRLNTAGRTLTREEITFAWLKTGWDILATGNRSAVKCVADLKDTLAEIEVNLDNDETVGALSFLWSVCFNQGRLLSNKDLLKGETIRPMASQLSQNWDALANSVVSTAMQVNYRGLEYGKHYLSFNALVIFLTWKFLLDEWIGRRTLTTLQKDAAQKRGDELIREFCDRWLLCSQWAGTWGASGGKVVAAFASQLSADRRTIQLAMSAEAVVATLRTRMQEWLKSFEQAASNMIRTLGIAKREQVGEYYAPLWIWHRLEGERWACSQITLRNKLRGKARLEVDHVAPVKILEDRISDAPATEVQALGGRDDVATVLNSIGNCFLIEKTFNISKGKRSLYDFLGEVHEFSQGDVDRNKWAGALSVSESLLLSDVADLTELVMTIKAREAILKGDLVKFVSGSATRIDLK